MKNRITVLAIPFLLILSLVACTAASGQQNALDQSALSTIVAQNILMTQMAGTIQAVYTPATATATQLPATPTITQTPEFYYTATTQPILLTVTENVNCRKGPANYYPVIVSLKTGDQVQAVGVDPTNSFYYLSNPNKSNLFCWVWGKSVSASGDTSGLPMYTPQPTPRPTATPTTQPGISITYESVSSCGSDYYVRVFVRNTGSTTWKSVKISISDNNTGDHFSGSSDIFVGYSGCTAGPVQDDLMMGEESYVSNYSAGKIGYDPTGHLLGITITVYSDDGQGGTSVSQGISVTP
jgi:Bacterial SH3 domain.